MVHELKILPEYFEQVQNGNKTFELRKDDRNYDKFDYLYLREYWDGRYTGREEMKQVTYVLRDVEDYGLKKGFVILGMQ